MKRFKDPIYGYIEIGEFIVENIIDTPEFQRLRQIIQTSYSPLYASAVHNRFVHSLGVYHLGQMVSFKADKIEGLTIDPKRYKTIFGYACLLHDVGHAPFSHTGELFYLDDGSSREKLHSEIIELTSDSSLKDEIDKRKYSAAPHELMSVIVALKNFDFLFQDEDERSFFARCILGYSYSNDLNLDKSFLNCMVSMLNSSLIDVDKLDYLIRDAYITGFDTVAIDYERLLNSVEIIGTENDNSCKLVFSKAAVSIIENVVFAHDAERKWIQNHPVVQYEDFILKYAMEKLNNDYGLFSYEALSKQGKTISDNYKIYLLSDGDVLFLMKNYMQDSLINEYFARNKRRHPLWKSESEYKAIFNPFSDKIFEELENEFEELSKYLNYNNMSSVINDEALASLNEDVQKSEAELENANKNKAAKDLSKRLTTQVKQKKKHVKWLTCLKDFAEEQKIDFDFIIIKADQFNSGFGKVAFDKVEIYFSDLQDTPKFKEIANALSSDKSTRDKFFYIFYRKNTDNSINVKSLAKEFAKLSIDECY